MQMKINATIKYDFTSVRMAITKRFRDNHWPVCGEKQNLCVPLTGA
jgi:hypothetical protein